MRSIAATLLFILFAASSAWADGEEDNECMVCHGDRSELAGALTDKSRDLDSLLVDWGLYQRSVHVEVSCDDCHQDFDTFPHDGATMSCAECHDDPQAAFEASVHGHAKDGADGLPITCVDCHGAHGVFRADSRESRLHPLNTHLTCGRCHFEHDPATLDAKALLNEEYIGDGHGYGIVVQGLAVSATCVSCHGGHEIRAAGDPESRLARTRVNETCGSCHVGVLEEYEQSIHHELETGPNDQGATCTDCHPPHHIDVSGDQFRSLAVAACGRCHVKQSDTFHESFHGKVADLGFGRNVATCNSCHGNHRIVRADDPTSPVHPSNIVATCAKCHEGAHAEFARYQVHADAHDPDKNPGLFAVRSLMGGLLLGTFLLAGIHSLLWLVRSLVARDWRRPPPLKHPAYLRRWPRLYSALHVTMMFSFLTLAVTGLPLHYHQSATAQSFMNAIGGVRVTSVFHRVAGVTMLATILAFLVNVFVLRLILQREKGLFSGPNTMLPRWQDAKDVAANVRWFLFLGPRPKFDRWTYWEKFDFWAVFWGIAVIGGSGLVMWFPVGVTRLLPSWVLDAAMIIHGHEALLAVGFIFTVHIFHTQLRPEKFPVDIFFVTGRMTEEEYKHERPLEYERLVAEGRLEEVRARKPRPYRRALGYVIAAVSLTIGITLVVFMIAALLS